jgi:CheY-like chemotaxis protein
MNRKVLVLVDDLFWKTKIDHAVRSAQAATPVFLSDPAELSGTADAETTCAVLVDLAMRKEPFEAIASLKKKPKTKHIPVIGYHEHVRKDLKEKAEKAGCDQVLPRSTFSQNLADLVLKYALPGGVKTEEEEQELPEE